MRLLCAPLLVCLAWPVTAQESTTEERPPSELPFQPGKGWVRLARDHEIWMDLKKKEVLVGGRVCLREGLLEMFACPRGTKEHESIVAINSEARFVHAGLVAVGGRPGPPVQFQPEYRPAQGTEIDVRVIWKDAKGKQHEAPAQQWVKHIKSGEALQYPWVFAGSGFWTDERTDQRYYYADGGDFICVSNFPTATLDLPVESSQANDTLMFCAFTERIPPRETRVFLVLSPKAQDNKPDKEEDKEQAAEGKAEPKVKVPEKKAPEKKAPEKKAPEKKAPEKEVPKKTERKR
jgi:hypothetical protein